MRPMERIVVVDDDPQITAVIGKLAQSMGLSVATHNDPVEAAKETDFDLLITDFMMPNLSGIELIRILRRNSPDAVRIMVTAASDFNVATQAVNDGEVFRLIGKPWHIAELRQVLKQGLDVRRLVKDNKRLAAELTASNAELTVLNQTLEKKAVDRTNALFEGMIRALDYRDTETQWHSWRVSKYTRRIAESIGIVGEELSTIEQGALLHDIGKIGVPDSILLKNGPLDPDQWLLMRKHPVFGLNMLAGIEFLKEVAVIVHQHQERWDGQGYPQGLKGEEITIGARIFSIADTLDAIVSDRPYRKGRSLQDAIDEISQLGGSQFDPRLVEAFLAIPPAEWIRIRESIEVRSEAARKQDRG